MNYKDIPLINIVNIALTLTFFYALAVIFVHPGELFSLLNNNEKLKKVQLANANLKSKNELSLKNIESWEKNREGYLRYNLNYIGSDEKFLRLDDK